MTQLRFTNRTLLRSGALAAVALLALASPAAAGARGAADRVIVAAAPPVTVAMVSDTSLTLDSNRPCTEGPRTIYVAFRVTNTSSAPIGPLDVAISGFANGIQLVGAQPASYRVGSLAAGASATLYWYVEYPCAFGTFADITARVTDGSAGAVSATSRLTTRSMLSAQAGGNLVSQVIGAGAVVGQIISMDVQYTFGGVSAGDQYNMQPAGNNTFDARCFRLVSTVVTQSGVTAVPVGATNQQLFVASAKQTGTGHTATIRWNFKLMCAGASTSARPYATQQSGSSNLKYSGNYEAFIETPFPTVANGFALSASATPDTLVGGGAATVTVTVQNTSAFTAILDELAATLPAGVVFQGLHASSGVDAANTNARPSAGATGTVTWLAIADSTWRLASGASISLVFTAVVTSTPGTYTIPATAVVGYTTIGPVSDSIVVIPPSYAVAVTPQGLAAPLKRLPGTAYSQDFVVTHGSNIAADVDLLARVDLPGAGAASVDSLVVPAGSGGADSARVTLAVGATATVTVWYTVAAGDTALDVIRLTSRVVLSPAVTADGWAEIRRVRPVLALMRSVSPSGTSVPGTDITWTLQFSNAGEESASGVVLVEAVATPLALRLGSLGDALPAGVSASLDYSTDGATWGYAPVSAGCGAAAGYDACVRAIRWTLAGTLPADAAASSSVLQFVARIR